MRHTDEQIRRALAIARDERRSSIGDGQALCVLADTVEEYRPVADAYIACRRMGDMWMERAERAENALREIEALESDRGTYDVVWDGTRQWVPVFKVIARAALQDTKEPA